MPNLLQHELFRSGKRILLSAIAAGIAAAPAAFGNLLEDPSFDSYPNGRFDYWTIAPKPNVDGITSLGTASQDLDGGYPNGANAIKFTFSGSGKYTLVAKGTLPLEPGRKYRLTVHARSSGEPVKVRTEVRPRATGQRERTRTISLNFNPGTEWQKETTEWLAAENEIGVDLVFYLENASPSEATIWLDEITIDPIDG